MACPSIGSPPNGAPDASEAAAAGDDEVVKLLEGEPRGDHEKKSRAVLVELLPKVLKQHKSKSVKKFAFPRYLNTFWQKVGYIIELGIPGSVHVKVRELPNVLRANPMTSGLLDEFMCVLDLAIDYHRAPLAAPGGTSRLPA